MVTCSPDWPPPPNRQVVKEAKFPGVIYHHLNTHVATGFLMTVHRLQSLLSPDKPEGRGDMGVGTYMGFLDAALTWDLQYQKLCKSELQAEKGARYKKTVTGSLSPRCLDVNGASLSPQPERLGAELELHPSTQTVLCLQTLPKRSVPAWGLAASPVHLGDLGL